MRKPEKAVKMYGNVQESQTVVIRFFGVAYFIANALVAHLQRAGHSSIRALRRTYCIKWPQ